MAKIHSRKNKCAPFVNVMKYLSAIITWPQEGKKFPWIDFFKTAFPLVLFGTPMLVGLLGHIYICCIHLIISDLINDILFFGLFSVYVSCGILFFVYSKKVEYVIWKINHRTLGNRDRFKASTKKIEFYTTVIHHYTFCIGSSYVVLFLFWDLNCDSRKTVEGEQNFEYMSNLPMPFWLPIDLNISLWKYFLTCCNIYNLGYILPKGATMTILYYGFIVFAVDDIDYLTSILKEVNPRMEEKKAREKLILYVKHYAEITRFVEDINNTVGVIFAVMQNGMVSIIIAVLEYQVLMGKGALAILPLSLWLILQAVACNCGQTLEDASARLRNTVYNMPWYKMKVSFQKDFRIFHSQVKKGFHLKMKPSILMNMEYYYQFMNGSYSILMFLINIERKNMK